MERILILINRVELTHEISRDSGVIKFILKIFLFFFLYIYLAWRDIFENT